MVDTALFIGMSGAKETMRSLQIISNNLANVSTTGFKADYETMKPHSVEQGGMQTRVYGSGTSSHSDFKSGPIIETGEALDIAILGSGFIAVQTKEGKEAYTRAGNLNVTSNGLLVTSKGDMVLSTKGLINVPLGSRISIDQNGGVSAQLAGQKATELTKLGDMKLVDLPIASMQKGEDGLFYLDEEASAPLVSHPVKVRSGALEGSNVDSVMALAQMIDISRQFEMHTKLMKAIEDNSSKSNQLLDMT